MPRIERCGAFFGRYLAKSRFILKFPAIFSDVNSKDAMVLTKSRR